MVGRVYKAGKLRPPYIKVADARGDGGKNTLMVMVSLALWAQLHVQHGLVAVSHETPTHAIRAFLKESRQKVTWRAFSRIHKKSLRCIVLEASRGVNLQIFVPGREVRTLSHNLKMLSSKLGTNLFLTNINISGGHPKDRGTLDEIVIDGKRMLYYRPIDGKAFHTYGIFYEDL
jgi:hypothetical protein